MTTVKVAEFRSHLSKYLHKVRQGSEIIISDRKHPIARITPYSESTSEALKEWKMIEPAKGYAGFAKLKFKPLSSKVDALEELLSDRRKR